MLHSGRTGDSGHRTFARASRPALALRVFLLALAFSPSEALAESGIMAGFTLGGAMTSERGREALRFRIGGSVDWLFVHGLVLSSRLDTTHDLDSMLTLLSGWWAPGFRENRGWPVGFAAGPAFALLRSGRTALGARGQIAFSLWYSRVSVELDTSVIAPIDADRVGPRVTAGLALRFVPWSVWRL